MTTNTALENIESLRLPELRTLFAEVTGKTTKSPNKTYLIRTIREALAAQVEEVIAEDVAIQELATSAATEPEPATEPANVEPAPMIAEEPAPAPEPELETTPEPATEPTTAREIAEEPDATETTTMSAPESEAATSTPTSANSAEPEPATTETTEDEDIEMLATEAELAEMAAEDTAADTASEKKLSKMSVAELQARYLEVVGRPTGSSHKRYLVWKIREAQKGKVPVGPRSQRASTNDADLKILPLRMESTLVERLDEARQRMGLKSRMDLFRKALGAYLAQNGEDELAAALAAE